VYSNSVLEHIGGYARRQAFATSVHSLAERSWIQMPYRYFLIEPHWVFPGFQWMPLSLRSRIARHWVLAHEFDAARSHAEVLDGVLSVELLSKTEMRHLFPSSRVIVEHFLGLPKSLIAVR
jgi:hypothetical protein